MQNTVAIIIPNWNGAEDLRAAIQSILTQSYKNFELIIVDNGSTDASKSIITSYERIDKRVTSIYREKNYGYTGGVNPGFEAAIHKDITYAAPFNNDAIAHKDWLANLVDFMDSNSEYGIATCSLLQSDGRTIDSTADQYTIWGLSYPRGRDEPAEGQYDNSRDIFGASGGASIYRVAMLKKIGLLDQDFFAYYEDVDISFRAQLAGWKVSFVPKAIAYHAIGKTSKRIGNPNKHHNSATPFVTKQFMKNLPYIIVKDVPLGLLWHILPRFSIAYTFFFLRAIVDKRGWSALSGMALFWLHLPKKLMQRRLIQKNRLVSNAYLWSIVVHDMPPAAHKLRRLRTLYWRLTGRKQ